MKLSFSIANGVVIGVILPELFLVGCKFKGGNSSNGGDNSIVLAVGGITDDDINLNLNYKLLCKDNGGQNSRKPIDGQVENKTKILFKNASEVKPADKCAFEARLPDAKTKEPPFKDYQWYAATGDKKEVGLMYASQLGQVSGDRKLTLEVFKVYDPPSDPNGFQVTVKVSLPEDKDVTLANLKGCTKKDGGALDNAVGEVLGNGGSGTSRTLSFNLSKDYIDGKCSVVSVLDNANKQSYSVSNVNGLVFSGVKAKDTVAYPKDGSELKLAKDSTGSGGGSSNNDLDINAQDKGECKTFDINTRTCKDGGQASLGGVPNVIAKTTKPTIVQLVATKGGSTETIYLTGKDGLNGLSADVSLDTLNNGTINTGNHSFFKPERNDFNPKVVLDKPLSLSNVSGAELGQKLGDLKDYKFTKINAVWTQRFIETSRVNVDKFSNPVWFAKVVVSKGNTKEPLIVLRDGFASTLKDKLIPPGKSGADSTYFNWDAMLKSEAKGFKVHSLKKCGKNITEVEKIMSVDWGNKTIEDLKNAADRSLKDCLVGSGDDLIKGGWQQAELKIYQLLWIASK